MNTSKIQTEYQVAAFRAHMANGSKYGAERMGMWVRNERAAVELEASKRMAGSEGWLNRRVSK